MFNKLSALVLVAALTVGCAGRLSETVVDVDTTIVNSLLAVKAAKDVRCDAGEIPESTCKALAAAFVPVWDAYLTVNSLIAAEAELSEIEPALKQLRSAAFKFQDVIVSIQGNARQILLDLLAEALSRFDLN